MARKVIVILREHVPVLAFNGESAKHWDCQQLWEGAVASDLIEEIAGDCAFRGEVSREHAAPVTEADRVPQCCAVLDGGRQLREEPGNDIRLH